MNLLAHLHLSEGYSVAVGAGNLLADFLRRTGAVAPDGEFAAGVRLHRCIDAFADAHPALRAARAGLPPPWRRWGGILADIACDYCLSRDWRRFHSAPLPEFVRARLTAIQSYLHAAPTPMRPLFDRMRSEDWLLAYGTPAGLRLTFERLSRRSPAAAALRGAEQAILARESSFQEAFETFYPECRAHLNAYSTEHITFGCEYPLRDASRRHGLVPLGLNEADGHHK